MGAVATTTTHIMAINTGLITIYPVFTIILAMGYRVLFVKRITRLARIIRMDS
jgi:hypothetical protein